MSSNGPIKDTQGNFIKVVRPDPDTISHEEQLGEIVKESIDRQKEMAIELRASLLSIVATIERLYNLGPMKKKTEPIDYSAPWNQTGE